MTSQEKILLAFLGVGVAYFFSRTNAGQYIGHEVTTMAKNEYYTLKAQPFIPLFQSAWGYYCA